MDRRGHHQPGQDHHHYFQAWRGLRRTASNSRSHLEGRFHRKKNKITSIVKDHARTTLRRQI